MTQDAHWQWCQDDRDITGDYYAEEDATEARQWTETGHLIVAFERTPDGWVLSGADGFDWVSMAETMSPLRSPTEWEPAASRPTCRWCAQEIAPTADGQWRDDTGQAHCESRVIDCAACQDGEPHAHEPQ